MAAAPTSSRPSTISVGLSVPNMADPNDLVTVGVDAEASGWDGVFLWDHVHGDPSFPVPTADPWVVLGALAVRTERIRLGTTITPLARRRPQKLARETVTVDHLSGGRMVLGVGLGEPPEEYLAYGDAADRQTLASKLDEGLEVIAALWSGEVVDHHGEHYTVEGAQYLPAPVQTPRIPVWTSCVLPHQRPLARAARWDGVILAVIEGGAIEPTPLDGIRTSVKEIATMRPSMDGFDVVVTHPGLPDADTVAAYAEAGATWVLVTGWMEELGGLRDLARRGPG